MVLGVRSTRILQTLLSLFALSLATVAGAQAPADPRASGKVGDEVLNALALAPRARVMVVFAELGWTAGELPRAATGAARQAALSELRDDVLSRLPAGQFELRRSYRAVHAFAGEITLGGLVALLRDPRIVRVDLDAGGSIQLAEAIPLTNVDDFQSIGFTGDGVTVAVLDTGYDTDHPDLSDDLVDEACFCSCGIGCCPDGTETQLGSGAAEDDHGHGTHVSGIMTSNGTVAPPGVAPDAEVVAVKVLDDLGRFCRVSDVVAGLDWVLDERPDVDLVNLSLATFTLYTGNCDAADADTMALAEAIDGLRSTGVTVFAGAGNDGSGARMGAPACVANSISVGAVYDANVGSQSYSGLCSDLTTAADQVTCFSNSNATTDLFAPGAYTTSTWFTGGTESLPGTSQASPFAAGCAALLLDKAPATSPDYLEERLEASPVSVTDATNNLSFPRVDCYHAGTPCVSPVTLDLDVQSTVLGTQEEVACETLTAGPYPIGGTGDVTFRAGERIVLRDGFEVADSGSFRAVVDALLLPPS